MKHTPAPWLVDEDPYQTNLVSDIYHNITAGIGYFNEGRDPGFSLTGFMSKADARLIAASPDLKETLEEILEVLCELDTSNNSAKITNRLGLLEAKAESLLARIENKTEIEKLEVV